MRRRTFWLTAAVVVLLGLAGLAGADTIRVVDEGGRVNVVINESSAMLYKYGGAPYKPYVEQLWSPGGAAILLDAPPDHLHHHALMYAVTVDGVNFWEEATAPGRQKHVAMQDVRGRADDRGARAEFGEVLDWVDPGSGRALLQERREIRLYRSVRGGATALEWKTTLSLPEGKASAVLSGAHYHGLGLRFVRSMDKDGRFFNADGTEGTVFRGSERLVKSRWCAYMAAADGREVTVAMFDDPNNPRHPAMWFVIDDPFAYMSATLNLHVEPLTVQAERPLSLRYGVMVWDGRTPEERIERAYQRWVGRRAASPG